MVKWHRPDLPPVTTTRDFTSRDILLALAKFVPSNPDMPYWEEVVIGNYIEKDPDDVYSNAGHYHTHEIGPMHPNSKTLKVTAWAEMPDYPNPKIPKD